MLLNHIEALNAKRIVLASASPRRKELLSLLGLSRFEQVVSSFQEDLSHASFPLAADYALETARHKAIDVAQLCAQRPGPPVDLIISADTVVEHNGTILEKADSAEHAREMLSALSGSSHHVHTGVVLLLPQAARKDVSSGDGGSAADANAAPFMRSFAVTTRVTFDTLTPDLIQAYIDSGEPFGKAGSYGIQGKAGSFVTGIEGDYYNVVGFPLHRFSRELLALIQDGYLPLQGSPVIAPPAAVP